MTSVSTCVPDLKKRETIVEQAIRTFAEFGYRNTNVQMIADRSGVGKGTVYRYFGNKEELFWALLLEIHQGVVAEVLSVIDNTDGALNRLRKMCLAYVGFFDSHPDYVQVIVESRAQFHGDRPESHKVFQKQIFDQIAETIRQGVVDGEIPAVDIPMTLVLLSDMLFGLIVFSTDLEYLGKDWTLMGVAEHGLDVFLAGLQKRAIGNSVIETATEFKGREG